MYNRDLDPYEHQKDTEVFIHLADTFNEIAEAGLGAIISVKQKEEYRKQKEDEMRRNGETVPEDRTPTCGEVVEPRFVKLEKGKEQQGIITNSTEVLRFLLSIIFAVISLAGDAIYEIHKRFLAYCVNNRNI